MSIALALNGANLYGYIKCKVGTNDNTSSFSNFSSNFVWQQLIKNVSSFLIINFISIILKFQISRNKYSSKKYRFSLSCVESWAESQGVGRNGALQMLVALGTWKLIRLIQIPITICLL